MHNRRGPPRAAFLFLPLLAAVCALLAFQPPAVQAQETPKYVAIGDSLAYGLGASEPGSDGFVARVHRALETSDRFGDSGIELINLSVPGATSDDLLRPGGQLDNAVREIQQSDVPMISIDIGGNDLLALADVNSPCLTELQTEPCLAQLGETLNALQANLAVVLQRLREAAPDATIVVVDLYNPFSGTGDIRELIADVGVQQINGVIGAAVSNPELNVELASVFTYFQGRGNQWVSNDGIHPNDDGHAVIAEVVLATLDGRDPALPERLVGVPPDPVLTSSRPEANDDGGISTVVLLVAVALAFIAGAAVSGAFFVVRGR